ncbi:CDP-alcohol phosphatidyltransferase family protein [Paracoccus sp. NSM]|uniref:CDP-alcohol phosphatidyltransferase family protein n=1 Tax=Paracoccus sp. NSM TaxID=3457784 RepID=UPI0040363D0B
MIDAALQPLQRRMLAPVAGRMARAGICADHVSILGFVIGLGAVAALAMQAYLVALVLLLGNRLADGLDGAIARQGRPTDRGAFLDIALDFVFYALFPLGFAIGQPDQALPAAVLIAAFVGTGSSFLAFAAIAARRGPIPSRHGPKGIHYLGGLTEGAETIAVFVLICLWPAGFATLAYLFAAACLMTTLTRWHQGWLAFSPENDRPHRQE